MRKVCKILLVSLILLGTVYAGSRPEKISREEKNKLLVEVAMGAINKGDWELMAKLFSTRFIQHSPGSLKTITWADFELGCRIARHKMPTSRIEIEDIIAEGNRVAARLKTIVTYKAKYAGGRTTEKKIEFTEMDLFRIESGKIVEEWCEYDTQDWKEKLRMLQYVKTWK